MKQCSNCKELKPLDNFQRDSSKHDGRQSRCKACLPKRKRPSDAARQRNWRACNPDKVRKYRERAAAYQHEYQRDWRARNPDKVQKYQEHKRAKRAEARRYKIVRVGACVVCDKPLTHPLKGRRKLYCSEACRRVVKQARNVAADVAAKGEHRS